MLEQTEVIFKKREEAEETLKQLKILNNVRAVSIYDYHEILGIKNIHHSKSDWGWRNVHDARVLTTHTGFTIHLPRAKRLRKR